jgi:hypothetical protein
VFFSFCNSNSGRNVFKYSMIGKFLHAYYVCKFNNMVDSEAEMGCCIFVS